MDFQENAPQHSEMNVGYEGGLHHFRTEIPNIVFEMKLDIYELSTYCHLKRTAGDKRSCWKSTKTLCEEIGISLPKLIEVKKSLVSRGLIRIEKRKHENGGSLTDLVTIIDVWPLNMKVMLEKYPIKEGGKPDLGGGVNDVKGGTKCHLPKQEHKEEKQKEQQQGSAAASFKSSEKEQQQPKMTAKLQGTNIPLADKMEIAGAYEPKVIDDAIDWATDPKNPPKKCLAASIKFGCKNKLKRELPKPDAELVNKTYAMKYNGQRAGNARVEALHKTVEIDTGNSYTYFALDYAAKGFMEQFTNALRKNNFRILEAT